MCDDDDKPCHSIDNLTMNELREIWHRLNCSDSVFAEAYQCGLHRNQYDTWVERDQKTRPARTAWRKLSAQYSDLPGVPSDPPQDRIDMYRNED